MKLSTSIFCTSLVLTQFASAQEVPDNCVQLPERQDVCPNLLYKKSPIDVEITGTKKGDIVCICMADFSRLRIPASSEIEKVDQQVDLSRAATKLNMSEQELIILIRK